MSFFNELKRRNVIRVSIAYAIAAWFLLQISDLVLENINAPDWVMQTIMLVLAIGFPLVMLFAWAFEMTPEGIKREKDVDRSSSITNVTGRKLDRMIIGVLVITVGYLLVDKLVLQKTPEAVVPVQTAEQSAPEVDDGPSVAVLPFVNMSGDEENEYFSDGLTETLLHMLAQLPDLRVAARTSSFAFKGQNKNVTEIAKELNVANILEGSVQKANNQIRVTAQLIKASDGSHIWSQNYTRPLEDIFAIQDEIAADVSDALGASLLEGSATVAGVDTSDLNAYDSYLKGLEQQAIFSYGSLEEAESHFVRALTQDPDFIDARLSLVRNYILKHGTGLINEDTAKAAIDPLIRSARESDPKNKLARALELTFPLQTFDPSKTQDEWSAIVNELRDTLHLLPTETYIRGRVASSMSFRFNEPRSAIEILQAGLMFDPLADLLHSQLGDIYLDQERMDEARKSYLRALEIAPENPNNYAAMSDLEKEADNLLLSLDWMRRAAEVDPQDHELASIIAEDLFKLELPEEGRRWLNRVQALAPGSDVARASEIQYAVARNDTETAVSLAQQAISDRIGFRRGGFFDAVFGYAAVMSREGRSKEAFEFLLSEFPNLSNYGEPNSDQHHFAVRFVSFVLRAGFEPIDQISTDWLAFTAQMDAMGIPWKDDPDDGNWRWDYIFKGQPEKAVDHYIEYQLDRPLAQSLRRHRRFAEPLFGPIYDDPRVKALYAEDERRIAVLREEVQEMLQGDEWQ